MFELFDPGAGYGTRQGCHLPHWFQPGVAYFVTFRTKDSIPDEVRRRWHAERAEWLQRHGVQDDTGNFHLLSPDIRKDYHERFSREFLATLDQGYGACELADPEIREMVAKSLHSLDGVRYHLGDYVIMPNHVHATVCPLADTRIDSLCTSWKRCSARAINTVLGRRGRFWQEDSFDHLIRTPEQFQAINRYIANNPRNLSPDQYTLYQRPK